jgi:hypothetical protein
MYFWSTIFVDFVKYFIYKLEHLFWNIKMAVHHCNWKNWKVKWKMPSRHESLRLPIGSDWGWLRQRKTGGNLDGQRKGRATAGHRRRRLPREGFSCLPSNQIACGKVKAADDAGMEEVKMGKRQMCLELLRVEERRRREGRLGGRLEDLWARGRRRLHWSAARRKITTIACSNATSTLAQEFNDRRTTLGLGEVDERGNENIDTKIKSLGMLRNLFKICENNNSQQSGDVFAYHLTLDCVGFLCTAHKMSSIRKWPSSSWARISVCPCIVISVFALATVVLIVTGSTLLFLSFAGLNFCFSSGQSWHSFRFRNGW